MGAYTLYVDFDNDGTFISTGENITNRLLSVGCRRGRDFASQIQGRSIAGILNAELNNESKDYSSFNSSSPLFGSLLPGRLVQLQENGTPLWTGYLKNIHPVPSVKALNVAQFEAQGPLGYLNQREVSLPVLSNILTGTIVGSVLDGVNWGSAKRTLDVGQTTISKFWLDKTKIVDGLRELEDTEAGFIVETKDGKVAYEDRHHRLNSPHDVAQVIISDVAGTILIAGIEQIDSIEQIANIFEANISLFTEGSSTVLWTMPESGTASPLVSRGGGTRIFWARYPGPDAASDAIAVNAWTTPASGTDFVANSSTGGTGTNLTSDLSVAVIKYGNEMKITLTNSGTTDAYLTTLQARGNPLTQADPVKVSRNDDTSGTLYGTRTFSNPAKWIPDTDEADSWCDYNLSIYKNLLPVLAVQFDAHRNGTQLAQARTREISDRITIQGTGSCGLGIKEDFFIEAIHHDIKHTGEHTVIYECSQAKSFSDFWILGVSNLGTNTRLAY